MGAEKSKGKNVSFNSSSTNLPPLELGNAFEQAPRPAESHVHTLNQTPLTHRNIRPARHSRRDRDFRLTLPFFLGNHRWILLRLILPFLRFPLLAHFVIYARQKFSQSDELLQCH